MLPERNQAETILPGMVWNVWVIDFVQERFQDMSPVDFESTVIKTWDSGTKEGLGIEEVRSQQQE